MITHGDSQPPTASPTAQEGWPEDPTGDAMHGLAGDAVQTIDPHTEAAPIAVLIQLLVGMGNLIGHGPHFAVEGDRHGLKLFAVLVGRTSKGRKGSSLGHVRKLLHTICSSWVAECIQSGLVSGEGLIWAVRDRVIQLRRTRTAGADDDEEEYDVIDPGVEDKRLLVVEQEFASVLRVAGRPGNSLSAIIREAWDTGDLRTMGKTRPAKATGAHISIIGHTTLDELRRYLNQTEIANGFANRFLWISVGRSKILPEGGRVEPEALNDLAQRLIEVVKFGRSVGELKRDEAARQLWFQVYPTLSEGGPGLFGAVTSRAEAQVMRLASIYALLDRSSLIRVEHLEAGLAVWQYAEASAKFIFGNELGDSIADKILGELKERKGGLTRDDIRQLFNRHKSAARIAQALSLLKEAGLARAERQDTDGRPAERWYAAPDV